ncbi:A disintegrin and metalloproteinase with thrombospondin motifs adt-1 [Halictus rubicundus]|uniref:A disintegrin and metalloproteinase with thrombospondin motifs adt-1 n=1 Tax=Halictus rubicundus TaxID=77578 RepID=UPI004036AC82
MAYLPYKMTPFTSKAGDVQNEELLRKKQSLEAANEYGNDENEQNDIGESSRFGPKIWDQWGSWSSCSVTCGIGKLSRWRHCIAGGCSIGEKKAQLKTCTLAAC